MDEVEATTLIPELTVAEVLERWPQAVSAFQKLKTACVGCTMAPFDTLEDVARIYHYDLDEVMAAVHKAIDEPSTEENGG